MRKIKFRGRRKNSDEWVYGAFLAIPKLCSYIYDVQPDGQATRYLVDEDTVGMYTGHSDVMGTDMYEGDIVIGYFEEDEWPAVVEWDEVSARFVLSGQNSVIPFDEMGDLEVTIIGNVHDNPEMLEAHA
jgi:hypothetical protein